MTKGLHLCSMTILVQLWEFCCWESCASRELRHVTHNSIQLCALSWLHLRLCDTTCEADACCGCVQVRERDWCNVISAHEGDVAAYTWLLKNFTLGARQTHAALSCSEPLLVYVQV